LTRRNLGALTLLAVLGLAVFWLITMPRPLTAEALPQHQASVPNGERLYNAGGCHSCHLPAKDNSTIKAELPAGGRAFNTPIGILYPPNLTPDTASGLGQWTDIEFVNAMQKGIGRDGQHLIPAFPYTSYTHMNVTDILDIRAYLATLPAIRNAIPANEVFGLPVVRRGLGLWKYIGLDETKTAADAGHNETWNKGRYLVDGPGHCNECHTPRTIFMTSNTNSYLSGGPHPEGVGKVPSLRGLVERKRFKNAADLASALQFGESMGYQDMSAGGMAAVQRNMSKLPREDLNAIAEYLISLK
jgi:mono/diheme cytochrome c family protein